LTVPSTLFRRPSENCADEKAPFTVSRKQTGPVVPALGWCRQASFAFLNPTQRTNAMSSVIDLRSDTITQPTDAMRKAMADAIVGDDVLRDDPTVKKLEALAAEVMGKEAALYVASGTMGNLVCQMVHCQRGDEMILGSESHIFFYEQGVRPPSPMCTRALLPTGPTAPWPWKRSRRPSARTTSISPVSRLIVIENTHNRCNGSPIDPVYMASVKALAERSAMKVHMDGARIFNAAHALGCRAADLARHADSVSFCLSKGLAAPVGSMVCGDSRFIHKARRVRKVLGGGMRQAGVLAAAGIVALTEMVDRLVDDHANARRLGEGLARISGIAIDPGKVKTNIVHFDIDRPGLMAADLVDRLDQAGVRVLASGPRQIRAVTQYHAGASEIEAALTVFEQVMQAA
jgi:threonine aldolase